MNTHTHHQHAYRHQHAYSATELSVLLLTLVYLVGGKLERRIVPFTLHDLPIAPNFFLRVKGPDGSLAGSVPISELRWCLRRSSYSLPAVIWGVRATIRQ